ncbi:MAG: M23 family metallopeptidase, partial [Myxococcaceae bacterium]
MAGCALLLGANAQASRSLVVEIQPGSARPGEIVLFKVRGQKELPIGKVGTRNLTFYPHAGRHEAMTGLSVDLKPGPLAFALTLGAGPKAKKLEGTIDIIDPAFPARELKVDNKFIEPPVAVKKQIQEDRAAFAKAFDQPFFPRMFENNFGWPRSSVVTARFGDRRTFNGKLASQHFGVDLNGRTGEPIFASNDGTV